MAFVATLALVVLSHQSPVQPDLKKLVAKLDVLQGYEFHSFAKFGDQAFRLVYPIATKRAAILQKLSGAQLKQRAKAIDLFGNAVYALTECATAKRTPEMMRLYESNGDYPRDWIFRWIAESGDAKHARMIFESSLTQPYKADFRELAYYAVLGMMRTKETSARAILAKILRNPNSVRTVRGEILAVLGATKDPGALAAIRESRRYGRMIPPLAKRWRFPGEYFRVRAQAADSQGKTVGIAEWDALGSPADWWFVQKVGGTWANPAFIGLNDSWPISTPSLRETKGGPEHHAKMKAILDSKQWTKGSLDGQRFDQDSDNDGYSDLIEKWFGLNPNSNDTDGDGIPDGIDKNPTAGNVPSTDAEKCVAAVFDIFSFRAQGGHPNYFVTLPKGMRAIELDSWYGLVLHIGSAFKPPTRTEALRGYSIEFTGATVSPSGTTCEVAVIEHGGYYESWFVYRCEKIGGEWYVVSCKETGSAIS
ncbi:MAG: hypothetical protein IT203_10960 [Fimbriimonadaceae bacterium]|nr:hypothetical protein [Fimbriimonadaceae bacterium]